MTKQEIFHRQLINSYVSYAAVGRFEEFMVRSELIHRTRELMGNGEWGPQEYARTTAAIFFSGDHQAYEEILEKAVDYPPRHVFEIKTHMLGDTTLKSVVLK